MTINKNEDDQCEGGEDENWDDNVGNGDIIAATANSGRTETYQKTLVTTMSVNVSVYMFVN